MFNGNEVNYQQFKLQQKIEKGDDSRYSLKMIGMKVLISETKLLDPINSFYPIFDGNEQINGTRIIKKNFQDLKSIPLKNLKSENFKYRSDIVSVHFDRIFS